MVGARRQEIFRVMHGFSSDGRLGHFRGGLIILLGRLCLLEVGNSSGVILYCMMNPNMVNNELYMEIKHKWRSIYPIYFDSSKTIQQGTTPHTQAEDSPKISASNNPPSSNSSELSALVNCAI